MLIGAGANQRLDVLGEAGSAVPRTGKEKRLADPPVSADAAPDLGHVGTHGFAQARDLVHERNPRCEHRVRGVLRHFRRRDVHHDQRIPGAHERRVQLFDDVGRFGGIHADDHAVRLHEIVDGRPLFQELGVRAHVEWRAGPLRDLGADPLRRSDRDGALRDDHFGLVHVVADRARHLEHVLQIGRAVLVGWRANRNEDDFGALHGVRHVRREDQAAVPLIPHDHGFESRLVDRQLILLERRNLGGIDVGANHFVASLREARTHDEPDVPRADDGYLHVRSALRSRESTWRVSTVARACRFTAA